MDMRKLDKCQDLSKQYKIIFQERVFFSFIKLCSLCRAWYYHDVCELVRAQYFP